MAGVCAVFCLLPLLLSQGHRKGAVIQLSGSDYYNFGDIPFGPEVSHRFTIVNTGDEPLIIKEVMSGTTYTNAEWPKEPIKPGGKGVITAYMSTNVVYGKFYRWFYIRSNATNMNCKLGVRFRIRGIIVKNE